MGEFWGIHRVVGSGGMVDGGWVVGVGGWGMVDGFWRFCR